MRFSIELGDWSCDGHCISKTFYVEVYGGYDLEQLKANYRVRVEELGFSLSDIAAEYEEPTIQLEYLRILQDEGLVVDPDDVEEDEDVAYIGEDTFIAIGMHLHGLKQSEWELVKDKSPFLFVGGYGLYSN